MMMKRNGSKLEPEFLESAPSGSHWCCRLKSLPGGFIFQTIHILYAVYGMDINSVVFTMSPGMATLVASGAILNSFAGLLTFFGLMTTR